MSQCPCGRCLFLYENDNHPACQKCFIDDVSEKWPGFLPKPEFQCCPRDTDGDGNCDQHPKVLP